MRMLAVILVALFGLQPQPGPAQNFAPMNMAAITQGAVMGQVLRNAYAGPGAASATGRPERPGGGDGAAVSLAYQPTAELRRETVDGYVSRLAQSDPEAARAVRDQFGRHDYAQVWRGLTLGTGLSERDAADSMAAFMMLGWMIANDSLDNPDPAHVQAVRAQLGPALVGEPRLSDPATRAALGEETKLLFVTLHAGWQGAQREGRLPEYADGVAAMFRRLGVDMRALRLTDAGFARR